MLGDLHKRVGWAITIIAADKDLDKGITDLELSKILGTNHNTLAAYRQERGTLMGKVLDNLVHHYHFHPMWLFFNEGEPFPGARAKYKDVCGPEEPPPASHIKEEHAAWTADGAAPAQQFNIMEDLDLAARVLGSATHYAAALHLNIRSFSGAIARETATEVVISKCHDDLRTQGVLIAQMQTRLDALDSQNKKLQEEMKDLKKTRGDSPPIALETDHAAHTGTDDQGT